MMMMVMVIMMMRFLLVNHALNCAKLFHVAGNSNGAFLIKAIFFFCFFQQLKEERMVDVDHRDHKPLLLLSLTHQDCQTPFWDVLQILLLMVVVKMEIQMVFMIVISSGCNPHIRRKPNNKLRD